jgi:hypothetical protein
VGPTEASYTSGEYMLTPTLLKMPNIQKRLLECDEFKNVKKLVILDLPAAMNSKGEAKQTATFMFAEGTEFNETVYLYTISLSPMLYDPEDFRKPVKDGVVISPTMHDPIDFTPRKSITVVWNPERQQDYKAGYDSDEKDFLQEEIIDKIKKAFENPSEYEAKGKRKIMLRMMPESVKTRDIPEGYQLTYPTVSV